MRAFFDDIKIKNKYLKRVREHAKADEIVKGQYWSDGKGCAVGCTIHSDKHNKYETELGIPEWLARVEDTIFEGLPNDIAKKWPERFLKAVRPGANLEQIKTPFIIFILEQNIVTLDNLKVDPKHKDVVAAIKQVREATEQMLAAQRGIGDLSAWSAAWSAAESAAESAWSAAWSAAESAAESARSAWSAAVTALSAARSARSAAYTKYANKLIELIEGCP